MADPTSNPYTFAAAFHNLGMGSKRRGVVLYWLTMMSNAVQQQYGIGELSDADILRMAHNAALPGTGPALAAARLEQEDSSD